MKEVSIILKELEKYNLDESKTNIKETLVLLKEELNYSLTAVNAKSHAALDNNDLGEVTGLMKLKEHILEVVSEIDNLENTPVHKVKLKVTPSGKLPSTTFSMLNIPIGSELIFTKDIAIKVKTYDSVNKVLYNGKAFSLSSLYKEVSGKHDSGFKYFTYNGKKLTDIREELGV